MAVTLQQIAEAAGVSRGTVDRALNNRGRIRPGSRGKDQKDSTGDGVSAQPRRTCPCHGKAEDPYRCDPSVYEDPLYAAGFKGCPGSQKKKWRVSAER